MSLIGIILYKICKNKWQSIALTEKIDLCLQVVLDQQAVLIPLQQFRGDPVDYLSEGGLLPRNILVTGKIFPRVHIYWGNGYIRDKITGNRIGLPTSFKLHWIHAFQLSRLLGRGHCARLMWKQHWKIMPIAVPGQTPAGTPCQVETPLIQSQSSGRHNVFTERVASVEIESPRPTPVQALTWIESDEGTVVLPPVAPRPTRAATRLNDDQYARQYGHINLYPILSTAR